MTARHRADTGTMRALATTAVMAAPDGAKVVALATAATLLPIGAAQAYTVNSDGTVSVQRGDTISEIAVGTGNSTRATLEANGLDAYDLIFPGDRVVLPGEGVTVPASTARADLDADAAAVVAAARAQIGVMYAWGGDGPAEGGFDCSGLTAYAFRAAGVSLPRKSTDQKRMGYEVSSPRPGDLVAFDGLNHVAIYVGNGRIVDASKRGKPIAERDLWTDNVTYRRLL